jgi:hypothetical protein
VDDGAVEPLAGDDELGAEVPVEVGLDGAACRWAGEPATPVPAVARPGAPAGTGAGPVPPLPRPGCEPVGAAVPARVAPDAGSCRRTPGAIEREAWTRSAVLVRRVPLPPPTIMSPSAATITIDASVTAAPISAGLPMRREPRVPTGSDAATDSADASGSHGVARTGSTCSSGELCGPGARMPEGRVAGAQSAGSHRSASVRGVAPSRSSLFAGASTVRSVRPTAVLAPLGSWLRSCVWPEPERLRSHAVRADAATTSAIPARRMSELDLPPRDMS